MALVTSTVIAKAPARGEKAPDFSLTTLDGKKVQLSDYRGKVVVLDFWATWCAPCVESIPHLNALQKTYAAKGLVVLGVSVDKAPDASVRAFARKQRIRYPVLLDPAFRAGELYGASSIPLVYIIGKDGAVRAIHIGYSSENARRMDAQVWEALRARSSAK